MTELMRQVMSGIIFSLGALSIILGLISILAREYQRTLRLLASHSTRLSGKAITEEGMAPMLDGMSRLLDSVRKLIATAVGVGAFLCLLGIAMVVLSYWILIAG